MGVTTTTSSPGVHRLDRVRLVGVRALDPALREAGRGSAGPARPATSAVTAASRPARTSWWTTPRASDGSSSSWSSTADAGGGVGAHAVSGLGYRTDDRIGRKSTPAWAGRVTPWVSRARTDRAVRSRRIAAARVDSGIERATLGPMPRPPSRPTPPTSEPDRAERPEPEAGAPRRPPRGGHGEPRGPAGRRADAPPHRPPHRRARRGLGDRPVRPPGGRGQRGDGPRGRDAGRQRDARRRDVAALEASWSSSRSRSTSQQQAREYRLGKASARSRSRSPTMRRRWPTTRPGSALVRLGTRADASPRRSSPGPTCCSAPTADAGRDRRRPADARPPDVRRRCYRASPAQHRPRRRRSYARRIDARPAAPAGTRCPPRGRARTG